MRGGLEAWKPAGGRHFAIGPIGPAMCFTAFQTIIQLVGCHFVSVFCLKRQQEDIKKQRLLKKVCHRHQVVGMTK